MRIVFYDVYWVLLLLIVTYCVAYCNDYGINFSLSRIRVTRLQANVHEPSYLDS